MGFLGKAVISLAKFTIAIFLSGIIAGQPYILFRFLGESFIRGISTLIFILSTILLTLLFHRKIPQFISFLKISALIIIGYIIITAMRKYFDIWYLITLGAILAAFFLYKVEILTALTNAAKIRIKNLLGNRRNETGI